MKEKMNETTSCHRKRVLSRPMFCFQPVLLWSRSVGVRNLETANIKISKKSYLHVMRQLWIVFVIFELSA